MPAEFRPAVSAASALLVECARDALLHAQVELYCDHDQQALRDLRFARQTAADCWMVPLGTRLEIEEATWHLRHHETAKALQSMQRARAHLAQVTLRRLA